MKIIHYSLLLSCILLLTTIVAQDVTYLTTASKNQNTSKDELLLVISVDGKLQALNKETGEVKWVSNLDNPMIGSREENQHELKKDFFIPLIDGSLIRFDQDETTGIAFLEKTSYNMRDLGFIDAISKDQCIVTGNSKTTAIQIDLATGEIL